MTAPSERLRTRLAELLHRVGESNRFYQSKWKDVSVTPATPLDALPFTTKAEIVIDQQANPSYGSNLSQPIINYTRLHQTSGSTTGRPLRWLDTNEGWNWVVESWRSTFPAIGIDCTDRCFFPFSFGPFLGFWSAFEACVRESCFVLSGGGASSQARVRQILDHGITAVFCTPTYALHLLEQAHRDGIDLTGSAVRTLVVAGEPGGNIPSTKSRIEAGWGARLIDHYGLTEVGPVAYEARSEPGWLSVIDSEIIAEVIDPQSLMPVPDGTPGELVVTNLGRVDSPLIRYRTGDLVKRQGRKLDGGVIGRTDDMIHVRGNNLYPSAIEAIVRRFPDVAEFRIVVSRREALTDVEIEIEPVVGSRPDSIVSSIEKMFRDEFAFRVNVVAVPPGTLPRFELKAKRLVLK